MNQNTHENAGEAVEEILQRMRRLETRVTNVMRSVGLMPTAKAFDPEKSGVHLEGRVIHINDLNTPIAAISQVAVVNATPGIDTTFQIVLLNQAWGEITVRGARY